MTRMKGKRKCNNVGEEDERGQAEWGERIGRERI